MKPDLYTKAVLTVIAFMLVMIGCHQYVNPTTAVQAEGSFAGVQLAVAGDRNYFFDPRTGDIYQYYLGTLQTHYKLAKLGAHLTKICWTPEECSGEK